MKPKFNVGDVVREIGANKNAPLYGEIGRVACSEIYDGEDFVGFASGDEDSAVWYAHRFQLVKPAVEPNSVNAEGKAIFFDLADLKPFMRVERKEGTFGIYVGEVGNEGHCVIGDFKNGSTWTSDFALDSRNDYSETVAVYDAPYVSNYLDSSVRGKLIWKRQAPKTSEQLAQEAALIARYKAIEEAEKALKMAQEKLNELKGL